MQDWMHANENGFEHGEWLVPQSSCNFQTNFNSPNGTTVCMLVDNDILFIRPRASPICIDCPNSEQTRTTVQFRFQW